MTGEESFLHAIAEDLRRQGLMGLEPEDDDDTEPLSWTEAYERFDDMLDEIYGTVKVAWFDYDASRAIKELDPIAYRCEFLNWANGEGIDTNALTGEDREGN